jgi:hydrogenase maturation protease
MRVLIGGIGYRNLRDHSFGPLVIDRLSARAWPEHVSVEDISYGPIAVVQRLEDDPVDERFELAIVAAAAQRDRRPPGTLCVYRWDNVLPGDDRVQVAISEAITGVIALDNTLLVARRFGALPLQVVIIEVEPVLEAFGEELSPVVERTVERACDVATRLALDPPSADVVSSAPLGGGWPAAVHERHSHAVSAVERKEGSR